MTTRIMLDLETMGNTSNAAITAIGAVKFDHEKILDRFEVLVDLQSCLDAGMEVTASTVLWWLQQSEEARAQFKEEADSITLALAKFSAWVGHEEDIEIWGNGASFDNDILANAYRKCTMERPWPHWADRCYRMIKAKCPSIELRRVGTHHRAVDDAESQALHLIEMERLS